MTFLKHRCLLPLVCILAAAGCGQSGPKRNPVAGTVKYKNEPIKYGTIGFRSDDGNHVGTADIKDGRYEIIKETGLPAGKYKVAISYPDPKVPAPKGDEPPGESLPVREMLPAKYADGSALSAEIKDGSNDAVDFDLK